MKAIRVREFGPPVVLKLEEAPDPAPGPDEVLVRIKAVGVNPVDAYIRAGAYGPREFPFTPGSDAAGVVEAVGENVLEWVPGDRVYIARTLTGAYAELALCEPWQVHRLPRSLSFAQGAAIHVPYFTAFRALFQKADARVGEWVLVHGASGGVGIAAVQLARASGLKVIGTAGTERGRELVRDQGAHHALDHNSPVYLDEIRRITGHPAGGCGVILEMLANVNLEKDFGLLAMGARIVVIGSRGKVEVTPRHLMSREARVLGMSLGNTPRHDFEMIAAALDSGFASETFAPFVGCELPLAEAARAHEQMTQPGAYGKIILLP